MIMAVLMVFFGSIFPGFGGAVEDGITVGEWLVLVNDAFGQTGYESQTPYYASVPADNEYFSAVQTAYEWGVITAEDDIDVAAEATNEFVFATLVRAAKLSTGNADIANADKLTYPAEIADAVALGLTDTGFAGKFNVKKIAADDALEALDAAVELWTSKSFANKADVVKADGEKIDLNANNYSVVESNGAYQVQSADGDVVLNQAELEDAQELSYQGEFAPMFQTAEIVDANGVVLQEATNIAAGQTVEEYAQQASLLQKIDVSFSVGGVKIAAKVLEDGFRVSATGNVKGINIKKEYELTDFNVASAFEGNIAKADIDYAYVRMDYNCVDTTSVYGSYSASVAPTDLGEGADEVDFISRVKNNLFELKKGGDSVINIFSVAVAVPNCPALTIQLDLKVIITFDGKVAVIVTSNESKGYEIVNNKGRAFSDSQTESWDFDIQAAAAVKVGLNLSLRLLGITLVDVEVCGGIGIRVSTFITTGAKDFTVDIPVDILFDLKGSIPNGENLQYCANIKVFGLVSISVGQNSIIKKIGLKKTWNLVDESNGVICQFHFEDGQRVPVCTRAA